MRILPTFTIVLCLLIYIGSASSTPPPFPQSVINYMATRQMRYHHYMWHQLRENWNLFNSTVKATFKSLGWEPPNPSRDAKGQSLKNTSCGEEFLWMHRNMINTANQIIAQNKDPYGKIKGWTTIPAPGDATYPVPPPYKYGGTDQSLLSYKTDEFYNKSIKPLEASLKDPAVLAKLTLNELGLRIESGIHNNMHMRWAAASDVGYRSGGFGTSVPNISKTWDNPNYNWLVDSYSSHVNPVFWRLHGWIDDRIEDWRRASNLTSIKWNNTWTGGPMSSLSFVMKKQFGHMNTQEADPEAVGDVSEKVMQLLMNSGVPEWSFAVNADSESNTEDSSEISTTATSAPQGPTTTDPKISTTSTSQETTTTEPKIVTPPPPKETVKTEPKTSTTSTSVLARNTCKIARS